MMASANSSRAPRSSLRAEAVKPGEPMMESRRNPTRLSALLGPVDGLGKKRFDLRFKFFVDDVALNGEFCRQLPASDGEVTRQDGELAD